MNITDELTPLKSAINKRLQALQQRVFYFMFGNREFKPILAHAFCSRIVRIQGNNPVKRADFARMFPSYCYKVIFPQSASFKEIISSDPIDIIVHKACQATLETFAEDTSLDVEGALDMGAYIKHSWHRLSEYTNKKASWSVLMAQRVNNDVYVYKGEISGTIVSPRGIGQGFMPYFQPYGSNKTLAEDPSNDTFSARARAVEAFCKSKPFKVREPILSWEGKYQKD